MFRPEPQTLQTQTQNRGRGRPNPSGPHPSGTPSPTPHFFWVWPLPSISAGVGVVLVKVVVVVVGLDSPGPPCARPPDAGPPLRQTPKSRVVLCCCCCCFCGCGCHCCCAHEWGPPGFHTTAQELQTCTFQAPPLQTPPKFHEKTPRQKQKERNGGGRGKKKREILGPPPFRAPPFGAPKWLFFCAFFILCSHFFFEKEGQKTETPILAKVGLSKVGHPNFGQSRSIKVGQSRSIFLAKVGISRLVGLGCRSRQKSVQGH